MLSWQSNCLSIPSRYERVERLMDTWRFESSLGRFSIHVRDIGNPTGARGMEGLALGVPSDLLNRRSGNTGQGIRLPHLPRCGSKYGIIEPWRHYQSKSYNYTVKVNHIGKYKVCLAAPRGRYRTILGRGKKKRLGKEQEISVTRLSSMFRSLSLEKSALIARKIIHTGCLSLTIWETRFLRLGNSVRIRPVLKSLRPRLKSVISSVRIAIEIERT